MKQKSNRITHAQFFRLCEELRNCRETVESCGSYKEAVAVIGAKVDFIVPVGTMEEAIKTVGITLAKRKRSGSNFSEAARIKTAKVLAGAIANLFEKLGEKVPEDFAELLTRLNLGIGLSTGKPVQSQQKATLNVPIKSVPNPQTIPVVNGRV